MTTRTVIFQILQWLWCIVFWAYVIHSFVVGLRHGFRTPAALHWVAGSIVLIEAVLLVLLPLEIKSVSGLLVTILVMLPAAPYFGWVIAGGPERCLNEDRK